jgi:hypothetical protein
MIDTQKEMKDIIDITVTLYLFTYIVTSLHRPYIVYPENLPGKFLYSSLHIKHISIRSILSSNTP